MPRRGGARSVSDSTHKSIEEVVEFIDAKIKKHNDVIRHHTDKLKYYHQIRDTLDGEKRRRGVNTARLMASSTKSSSKKVSSGTRSKRGRVDPVLQPVKEEFEEEPPVKKGRCRGAITS